MDAKLSGFLYWLLAVTVAVISAGKTMTVVNNQWQSELVKRGHAEYSPQTGEWQWKEANRE